MPKYRGASGLDSFAGALTVFLGVGDGASVCASALWSAAVSCRFFTNLGRHSRLTGRIAFAGMPTEVRNRNPRTGVEVRPIRLLGKIMMRRVTKIIAVVSILAVAAGFFWANRPCEALPAGLQTDRIVVWKARRQLCLYSHGNLLKTYFIALGHHPIGPKQVEGDKCTPEGKYFIESHKSDSSCHKALRTSYPSAADRARATELGKLPGGDIMIHGIRNGLGFFGRFHRFIDWTSGCIAVSNQEMDQIYLVVQDGTPIEIHP